MLALKVRPNLLRMEQEFEYGCQAHGRAGKPSPLQGLGGAGTGIITPHSMGEQRGGGHGLGVTPHLHAIIQ